MMRYMLTLLVAILIGCGTYKTQYYLHDIKKDPIYTIDSINCVHDLHIPLELREMSKIYLRGDACYEMYHYTEFRKDTMFVFSITIPKDEQRYIIKLKKELNE